MNRFFKIIAVAFVLLFVFAGCNDNSNVVTDLDVTIPPITDEPATEYNPELYTFNVSTDGTDSSENETSAPVSHPKVKFTMEKIINRRIRWTILVRESLIEVYT